MRLIALPMLAATLLAAQPAHSWTISADFDGGLLGSKADRGGDGFTGAGGNSIYSAERVVSGQAARLTIEEGKTGYGGWGGEFIFPEALRRGDKVWYQVYTYFPSEFDHYAYGEGSRLKFLRLQTKSADNKNHGYIDLYIDRKGSPTPFKWIYEGASVWDNVGSPSDMIVKDTWESYQMQVTLDTIPVSEGGMAEVKIWKNGKLLDHITDKKTLQKNTDFVNRALLFTYWNGGSPATQSMYVDEITITNETPSKRDSNGFPLVPFSLSSPPASPEAVSIK